MTTSKKIATKASKQLREGNSPTKKSVAGSDLSQAKKTPPPRHTSAKDATKASKILRESKNAAEKSVAASDLAQAKGRGKR